MFFCPIAANEPSAIEAIATNTTICCHCVTMPGNAVSATRVNTASAATFGAEAKNAVTGVGVLCLCAESRGASGVYSRGADRVSGHCHAMAADRGVRGDRLDGAGLV